jgi:hypothetical protein
MKTARIVAPIEYVKSESLIKRNKLYSILNKKERIFKNIIIGISSLVVIILFSYLFLIGIDKIVEITGCGNLYVSLGFLMGFIDFFIFIYIKDYINSKNYKKLIRKIK